MTKNIPPHPPIPRTGEGLTLSRVLMGGVGGNFGLAAQSLLVHPYPVAVRTKIFRSLRRLVAKEKVFALRRTRPSNLLSVTSVGLSYDLINSATYESVRKG